MLTQHFPPANIINVHKMSNSVIQQGTVHSSQSTNYSNIENNLNAFLTLLRDKLPELTVSEDQKTELDADITTIQAQTDPKKPKNGIIKESLLTIQHIVEGASGTIVAHQVLSHIPALLTLL